MTNLDIEVGAAINTVMFRRKITQTELAKSLGISQAALSKKLHGERKWALGELYAVAQALGVPVSDLLPGADTRQYHRGPIAA